ncbi:MAG: hypothetical protein AAGB10_00390 [Pseudomonadota bacterium]
MTRTLRVHVTETGRREKRGPRADIDAFLNAALQPHGFRLEFWRNQPTARLISELMPGYSLFLMKDPRTRSALTLRRGYLRKTWRLERSNDRDDWTVTGQRYDPNAVDADAARQWIKQIRHRHGIHLAGASASPGYVLVPLQGKLLSHRDFQFKSPVEMIEDAQRYEVERDICLTLHPGETYSREELAAIHRLAQHPRTSILQGIPMHKAIAGADYLVSQNSSVAYWGLVHRKPAILYAAADFHHICQSISRTTPSDAFRKAPDTRPGYAKYLYWHSLNALIDISGANAAAQLVARLRFMGWSV